MSSNLAVNNEVFKLSFRFNTKFAKIARETMLCERAQMSPLTTKQLNPLSCTFATCACIRRCPVGSFREHWQIKHTGCGNCLQFYIIVMQLMRCWDPLIPSLFTPTMPAISKMNRFVQLSKQ